MLRPRALTRPIAKIAMVGSVVAGLTMVSVGNSWADNPTRSGGPLNSAVSSPVAVLGMPLSTATWVLMGLVLIVTAMAVTSWSRRSAVAALRVQTAETQASTADRVMHSSDPSASYIDPPVDNGRSIPAVS